MEVELRDRRGSWVVAWQTSHYRGDWWLVCVCDL